MPWVFGFEYQLANNYDQSLAYTHLYTNIATMIIGTVCVSTLDQNYICRMPPIMDQSVVITGTLTQNDLGALSDLIQTEVERYLVN